MGHGFYILHGCFKFSQSENHFSMCSRYNISWIPRLFHISGFFSGPILKGPRIFCDVIDFVINFRFSNPKSRLLLYLSRHSSYLASI